MLVVTSNKIKQLLLLTYIGCLKVEDLVRSREDLVASLSELPSGFRVIADFTHLEAMDADCASEIGKIMELFDQKGIGFIARILADPTKDMGFNILAHFHYKQHPQMLACKNFAEAVQALNL